jgi:hypothetical protein
MFIFQSLSENVHMKGTKKAEATALPKGGGGFSLNSDTPVSQHQLLESLSV